MFHLWHCLMFKLRSSVKMRTFYELKGSKGGDPGEPRLEPALNRKHPDVLPLCPHLDLFLQRCFIAQTWEGESFNIWQSAHFLSTLFCRPGFLWDMGSMLRFEWRISGRKGEKVHQACELEGTQQGKWLRKPFREVWRGGGNGLVVWYNL